MSFFSTFYLNEPRSNQSYLIVLFFFILYFFVATDPFIFFK